MQTDAPCLTLFFLFCIVSSDASGEPRKSEDTEAGRTADARPTSRDGAQSGPPCRPSRFPRKHVSVHNTLEFGESVHVGKVLLKACTVFANRSHDAMYITERDVVEDVYCRALYGAAELYM